MYTFTGKKNEHFHRGPGCQDLEPVHVLRYMYEAFSLKTQGLNFGAMSDWAHVSL